VNTCGTCKYFGKPVDSAHYVPSGYHVCRLVEQFDAHERPSSVAGVVDASGYFAALCIREEFGCNQWAPRAADQESQ
jgi:hypothetical protein